MQISERKGQILDAALELFLQQGYDATPARKIAEAAGTSKANLYHHFASKDELLYALLAPLLDELESVLDEDRTSYGGASEKTELLGHYLDACLHHRSVAAFLGNNLILRANLTIGPRILEIHDCLLDRLCEGSTDVNDRIRAAGAVAVLNSAILDFEYTEEVREAALESARMLVCHNESETGGP